MKPIFTLKHCVFFFIISLSYTCYAQVGINTTSPNPAAALDVSSSNKGVLFTRVALTGRDDSSTISAPATGLLTYNTITAGSGINRITPGYFYWNGSEWSRLFSDGYTLEYEQTAEVSTTASGSTYNTLTGMDTGNITVPFSGLYQIIFTGYMAVNSYSSSSSDGAGQGCIGIRYRDNGGAWDVLNEAFVTSSSKRVSGTRMDRLARSATIVLNIELIAGTTYRFQCYGRKWLTNNINSDRVYFGRNTSGYTGASGVNDAQYGKMSISLIQQY